MRKKFNKKQYYEAINKNDILLFFQFNKSLNEIYKNK